MKSISKRFKAAQATVEPRAYAPLEAVSLVKANATAKFDETIEAHVRLGIEREREKEREREREREREGGRWVSHRNWMRIFVLASLR